MTPRATHAPAPWSEGAPNAQDGTPFREPADVGLLSDRPSIICVQREDIDFDSKTVQALRDTCAINLGSSKDFTTFVSGRPSAVQLIGRVPRGWESTRPSAEMMSLFLPEWYAGVSAELFTPPIDNDWGNPDGLWQEGYLHVCLTWALRTAVAFSHLIEPFGMLPFCGFADSAELRSALRGAHLRLAHEDGICHPQTDGLRYRRDGTIEILASHGGNLAHYLRDTGDIVVCEPWRISCALVDIFFWWANRLYSWALDGEGTWLDLWIGCLCAKSACASLIDIGGELIHEIEHKYRSSHCRHGKGKDAGIGSCQNVNEELFRRAARAATGVGLPMTRMPKGNRTSKDHIQYPVRSSWDDPEMIGCSACTDEAAEIHVDARHCGYLTTKHPVYVHVKYDTPFSPCLGSVPAEVNDILYFPGDAAGVEQLLQCLGIVLPDEW